jgi:hypothetical protein
MRTSCACVLLGHAYCLSIVRTACAWQRTDSLSAASLFRCACSAKKSSSGRTACSSVRMRLLCSHTGHRHPVPGLRTLPTFKRDRGNKQDFIIPQQPDPWIGPMLRIRIRSDRELFAGFGSVKNNSGSGLAGSGMNLKKNLFTKIHNLQNL